MPSLSDAIAITSATSGTVLATQTVSVGPLTGPQKTALLSFITSLGLSIPSANVLQVAVSRVPGSPNVINASVTGLVVPASAAAAITGRAAYDDIVGVVP